MYYKKYKNIARLVFKGANSIENAQPYSTISYDISGANSGIELTDNSFLVLEYISYTGGYNTTIRCNKHNTRMNYWDSTQGVGSDPIIFSSSSENPYHDLMVNPDPTTLYRIPIDKTFFNNPIIKFTFDTALTTTNIKDKLTMSFLIVDEEDVWDNTQTEVKKDDYINGKKFPVVY